MEGMVSDHFYRVTLAMIAAAVLAGAFAIFTATAEPAADNAGIGVGSGDGRPNGTPCSQQAWPYYEPHCVRERSFDLGQRKSLRVITTERW